MRLILIVLFLLSLQACGGGSDLPEDPEPAPTIQPVDCKARPDLCT